MSLHLRNNITTTSGLMVAGTEVLASDVTALEAIGAVIVNTETSSAVARAVRLARSAFLRGDDPATIEQIMVSAGGGGGGGGDILANGSVPFTGDQSMGDNALTEVARVDQSDEDNLGDVTGDFAIDWTEGAACKLVTVTGNADLNDVTLPDGNGYLQLRVVNGGAFTFDASVVDLWGDGLAPALPEDGEIIINLWRRADTVYGQWRAFAAAS